MAKGVKVKLISFGRGGVMVHYNRNHHSEGYEDPETFFKFRHWWADPPDKLTRSHEPEDCEGAVAIDVREAVEKRPGYMMCVSGPMVNVDLPSGEITKCPDLSRSLVAQAVKQDEGNPLGTWVRIHEAVKENVPDAPGPLDYVSIDEFVKLWRKAGARVGVVHDGKFMWEVDDDATRTG